jgi:hypothetical protein
VTGCKYYLTIGIFSPSEPQRNYQSQTIAQLCAYFLLAVNSNSFNTTIHRIVLSVLLQPRRFVVNKVLKNIFGSTKKEPTRDWNVQILVTRHEDNLWELAMHKLAYNMKTALKRDTFWGFGLDTTCSRYNKVVGRIHNSLSLIPIHATQIQSIVT